MRVFLTGATGFIGKAVMHSLREKGHEVLALSRREEHPEIEGVQWLKGSLAEVDGVALRAFAPEVLVHSAWISTPGVYLESPENTELLAQSVALFEQAYACGVGKIIALGTCIEYALGAREPLTEKTPCAPESLYARSKHALHQKLAALAQEQGGEYVWGRVFYPYGVGEHAKRLCSYVIKSLLAGEEVTIRTPESVKDYIYIDDLASAVVCLVEQPCSGALNLGSGQAVRVVDMLDQIVKHVGLTDLLKIHDTGNDPYPYVVADNARLLELGWSPTVCVQEGIQRLVHALKSQS